MNVKTEAKSITDVRNALVGVFNGLCSGSIEPKEAVEINNTAGKIISSLKVQLAYHSIREERPKIEFIGIGVTLEPKK